MTTLDSLRRQVRAAHEALTVAGAPPTGTLAGRIRMLDRAWAMRLQLAEADTAQWQAVCKDTHGMTPEEGVS